MPWPIIAVESLFRVQFYASTEDVSGLTIRGFSLAGIREVNMDLMANFVKRFIMHNKIELVKFCQTLVCSQQILDFKS